MWDVCRDADQYYIMFLTRVLFQSGTRLPVQTMLWVLSRNRRWSWTFCSRWPRPFKWFLFSFYVSGKEKRKRKSGSNALILSSWGGRGKRSKCTLCCRHTQNTQPSNNVNVIFHWNICSSEATNSIFKPFYPFSPCIMTDMCLHSAKVCSCGKRTIAVTTGVFCR